MVKLKAVSIESTESTEVSPVGRREPKANSGVIGMVVSYLVQVQAWALRGGNV